MTTSMSHVFADWRPRPQLHKAHFWPMHHLLFTQGHHHGAGSETLSYLGDSDAHTGSSDVDMSDRRPERLLGAQNCLPK